MRTYIYLFVISVSLNLWICTFTATAQVQIEWDKTLGGSSADKLSNVISISSGGYLLAGDSYSNASGDKSENSKGEHDYWVVKVDAKGNKLWDKTFGGSDDERLSKLISTSDGGYLLAGFSYSDASGDKSENSKGGYDYWIVKIDNQGNKEWDKTFGGSEEDRLSDLCHTSDGGYILAGFSYSNVSGDKSEDNRGEGTDYWIIKIDAQGNKKWDKTLGGNGADILYKAIVTTEGSYLLAGVSWSEISGDKTENSKGGYDYWIVKIDNQGNKVWDKTFGGSGSEEWLNIIVSIDGGYLLGGASDSPASEDKSEESRGSLDYWIVKIDNQGNRVWDKTIGRIGIDILSDFFATHDGAYILAGDSYSGASANNKYDQGESNFWLVKIDNQGNEIWDKTFGGNSNDNLSSVISTPDKGLLLAGSSVSNISGDKSEDSKGVFDYWIIKLKGEDITAADARIDSLTLVNAQTNKDIHKIKEDDVINMATMDCSLLSIRANTTPSVVDSVDFKLSGPSAYQYTDHFLPYTLFGEHQGDYNGKKLPPGDYTLTTTPFNQGTSGSPLTIKFKVIEGAVVTQPTLIWDKTFGGNNDDWLNSTISTPDGGYLLGGNSASQASGDKNENTQGEGWDFWIIKTDTGGNKQWDKTIGGNKPDYLQSINPTSDGGFLLAGSSLSDASRDKSENNLGQADFWVVKIDEQGNKLWDKTYGASSAEWLYSSLSIPGGGFLLAGSTLSGIKGGTDFWVVKIDEQGNKLWDKTYGGSATDNLRSAITTPDGGFMLGGHSDSNSSGDKSENSRGNSDFWIIKIDSQGNIQWDKTYGASTTENLQSLITTPDGGYLLAGASNSDASGDKSESNRGSYDYWVLKIDSLANKVWDKTLGGNKSESLSDVILTSDEGYLLAGTSWSALSGDKSEHNKGADDYWLLKIDGLGNKVWDKTIGGRVSDQLSKMISTPEGDYILAGISNSNTSGYKTEDNKGGDDYWILKLKGEDNTIVDVSIASLILVNAETDEDIQELQEGDRLNLAEVDYSPLNIRANTTPEVVDSVLFELQDPTSGESYWNEYHLVGAAFPTDDSYALTPDEGSVKGAAWNKHQLDLRHSFDFTFTVKFSSINEIYDTSDGMMFVLQQTGLSVLGGGGGSLGYYITFDTGDVILPSLGIELDIHNNASGLHDNSESHIALVRNQDSNPIVGPVDISPILKNGEDRLLRVVWNNSTKKLDAYLDGVLVLSHTEDIIQTVFQGNPLVYFGFTGGTGGGSAQQTFRNEKLIYEGPTTMLHTERKLPYALFGDDPIPGSTARDYRGKHLESGQYTLSATPYLNGQAGNVQTISFQVYSSLSVQSFNLVNAHDDEELQLLQDGDIIDLAMLPTRSLSIAALAENVGSIAFDLQGPLNHKQTENFAPHVLFGDNPRGNIQGELLAVGDYHLTATPYRSVNLQGNAGQSLSIHFSIINSDAMEEAVTAFMLYDATNDEQLMSLEQASVINLADLANRSLSVLALTHPEFVGSVKMELYGPINHTQIENTQPYALFRNEGQDFYGRVFPAGDYHLKATPYTKAHAQGEEGLPLDIYFTVAEEESNAPLAVYPIPTSGLIDVHYQGKVEEAELNLIDFSGQILLTKAMKTQDQLDLSAYRKGVYFLKVISPSNVQIRRILLDN